VRKITHLPLICKMVLSINLSLSAVAARAPMPRFFSNAPGHIEVCFTNIFTCVVGTVFDTSHATLSGATVKLAGHSVDDGWKRSRHLSPWF